MSRQRPVPEGGAMTEEDWLACDDPAKMIQSLRTAPVRLSWRKGRLFGCACCRRLEGLLSGAEVWKVLDAAERYAEGRITDGTADRWYRRACAARDSQSGERFGPVWGAFHAVTSAILNTRYGASDPERVCEEVAGVLADAAVGSRPDRRWAAVKAETSRGFASLLRDVWGNPFRPFAFPPSWQSPTVTALATAAYEERHLPAGHLDDARLAVLADALEEAGCDSAEALEHLRSPGPHIRGCWSVDLLTGRS